MRGQYIKQVVRHLSLEQVLSLVHTSHCYQLKICHLLYVASGQEMDKTVFGRLKLMVTWQQPGNGG